MSRPGRGAAIMGAVAALVVTSLLVVTTPSTAMAGPPVVASDFNGDGYGDVIVGDTTRTVSGFAEAGAAHVVYGSANGLTKSSSQYLTLDTLNVPGVAVANGHWGAAVATGDFNGDGYADAAISEAGYSDGVGSVPSFVVVLFGSSAGLNGTLTAIGLSEIIDPTTVVPNGEDYHQFGETLATGHINHDLKADLAIAYDGGEHNHGGVVVMYGSTTGFHPGGETTVFTPDSMGVNVVEEEMFGLGLALGDFNGDHYDDLAIGAPQLWLNGADYAGGLRAHD